MCNTPCCVAPIVCSHGYGCSKPNDVLTYRRDFQWLGSWPASRSLLAVLMGSVPPVRVLLCLFHLAIGFPQQLTEGQLALGDLLFMIEVSVLVMIRESVLDVTMLLFPKRHNFLVTRSLLRHVWRRHQSATIYHTLARMRTIQATSISEARTIRLLSRDSMLSKPFQCQMRARACLVDQAGAKLGVQCTQLQYSSATPQQARLRVTKAHAYHRLGKVFSYMPS